MLEPRQRERMGLLPHGTGGSDQATLDVARSRKEYIVPLESVTQSANFRAPAERVLVVTNEDLADANEVPGEIRPLLDAAEEIYVIAPTLTSWLQWVASDVDRARVSADKRLHKVFDHMHADGLQPRGTVGDEDQVVAIADALADFDADLILLRLHIPGSDHESWHEHRVAERVRSHFGVPTIAFFFNNEGHVVGRVEA
jgi:hypothetical protein